MKINNLLFKFPLIDSIKEGLALEQKSSHKIFRFKKKHLFQAQ